MRLLCATCPRLAVALPLKVEFVQVVVVVRSCAVLVVGTAASAAPAGVLHAAT